MHHQLHIFRQLYIYMHKQASWQFTYSLLFLHILKMQMNTCLRDLPTRKKSTLPSRVPTHAYADREISGQQPTQLYKEFPRVHEVGHWEKTLLNWRHVDQSLYHPPEKFKKILWSQCAGFGRLDWPCHVRCARMRQDASQSSSGSTKGRLRKRISR